jgi:hypothetical protein
MKEIFPLVFGVLFVSVFVWFGLCMRLFKLLETRHPEKYNAMGRPSLIMNNSLSNNISFMKFLFKQEYRELNDHSIQKLGQVMRAFSLVYMSGFLFLVIAFLLLATPLGHAR